MSSFLSALTCPVGGLLACVHVFRGYGSLVSGGRERMREGERERERKRHRRPSVHLWNDLAPEFLPSSPSMADMLERISLRLLDC